MMSTLTRLPVELLNQVLLYLTLQDVCALSQVSRHLYGHINACDVAKRQLIALLKPTLASEPSAGTVRQLMHAIDALRWEQWFDSRLKHTSATPHKFLPGVPLKSLRQWCQARSRSSEDVATFSLRIPLQDGTYIVALLQYESAIQHSRRYDGTALSASMKMEVPDDIARLLTPRGSGEPIELWSRSRDFNGEPDYRENDAVLQKLSDLFNHARVGYVTDWTSKRVRDMILTLTHTIWYKAEERDHGQWDARHRRLEGAKASLERQTDRLWNDEDDYQPQCNAASDNRLRSRRSKPQNQPNKPAAVVDAFSALLASLSLVPTLVRPYSGSAATAAESDRPHTPLLSFRWILPEHIAARVTASPEVIKGASKETWHLPASPLTTLMEAVEQVCMAFYMSPAVIFANVVGDGLVTPMSDAVKMLLTPLVSSTVSHTSAYKIQRYPEILQDTGYGDGETYFNGWCQLQNTDNGAAATFEIQYSNQWGYGNGPDRRLEFSCILASLPKLKLNMCDEEALKTVTRALGVESASPDVFFAVMFACAVGPSVPLDWAWKQHLAAMQSQ